MQYLLIISHDDLFRPTEELLKNIDIWIKKMEDKGIHIYGNPLQPPETATTVRIRKGKLAVTKGSFAKSKEKMCAYELVECANQNEAIEIASHHPMAEAATIEVRPVWNK
jgi:hypothetical protein